MRRAPRRRIRRGVDRGVRFVDQVGHCQGRPALGARDARRGPHASRSGRVEVPQRCPRGLPRRSPRQPVTEESAQQSLHLPPDALDTPASRRGGSSGAAAARPRSARFLGTQQLTELAMADMSADLYERFHEAGGRRSRIGEQTEWRRRSRNRLVRSNWSRSGTGEVAGGAVQEFLFVGRDPVGADRVRGAPQSSTQPSATSRSSFTGRRARQVRPACPRCLTRSC